MYAWSGDAACAAPGTARPGARAGVASLPASERRSTPSDIGRKSGTAARNRARAGGADGGARGAARRGRDLRRASGRSASSTGPARRWSGGPRIELTGQSIWAALPEMSRHDLPQLPAARARRRAAGDLAGLLRPGRPMAVRHGRRRRRAAAGLPPGGRPAGSPSRRSDGGAPPTGRRRRPGPAPVPRRGQRVDDHHAGHREVGRPARRARGVPAVRLGGRRGGRRGRRPGRGGLGAPRPGAARRPGHLHDRAAARHRRRRGDGRRAAVRGAGADDRAGPAGPGRAVAAHRGGARGVAAAATRLVHDRAAARPRRDVRGAGADELRRPAAAHRDRDRHRRRGGPPRRPGSGQRPALRPPAEGRRDAAAQPAHPPAAARRPADRRPLPAGRRPTSRSAGTGTTPSSSPTARRCWSSATSSGTTWTPPRRWARSAASCAGIAYDRPESPGPDPQPGGPGAHRPAASTRWPPRWSPGSSSPPTRSPPGCARCAGPRPGTCRRCCCRPDGTVRRAGQRPRAAARRRIPRPAHRPGRAAAARATPSSSTPTAWSSTAAPASTRASTGSPAHLGDLAELPLEELCDRLLDRIADRPHRRRHRHPRPPLHARAATR